MTIWDDDVYDPRPGASRVVTATAALFAAIAWAFVVAVRAGTTFGLLSMGALVVGGWIVGIFVIGVGFILSLMALARVMRDNVRVEGGSSVHFWTALTLVVSWPLWFVFALNTVLDW